MYQRLIIAHPWLSDRAEITATGTWPATLPVTNLTRSQYPTDWGRCLGLTTEITLHLPEVAWLEWDLIVPGYTNASADATWQIIAANSEAGLAAPTFEDSVRSVWPVPNLDRPGEPEWCHGFRWLKGNKRTEPWVRLIVNDPNPRLPDDYVGDPFIQWGRLYVALAWQPSYHYDRGSELIPSDEAARRVRVQGGGEKIAAGAAPRTFRFAVSDLGNSETLTKAYELDRIVGTSRDLLVCDDPEDPVHLNKKLIIGTLPEARTHRHDGFESNSRSYKIREMI